MADGDVVLDWSTAPREMREAFEKMQADTKALQAQAEADRKRLAEVDRRETFERVKAELGDGAKEVSLEDLAETPLEQITVTALKVKAAEKAETRQAALAKLATDAGFESVEAMQAFRAEADARKAATTAAQTTTAIAATSGQTSTDVKKSVDEVAFEAFNANPHLPHDERVAAFLGASIGAQLTEAEGGGNTKL